MKDSLVKIVSNLDCIQEISRRENIGRIEIIVNMIETKKEGDVVEMIEDPLEITSKTDKTTTLLEIVTNKRKNQSMLINKQA